MTNHTNDIKGFCFTILLLRQLYNLSEREIIQILGIDWLAWCALKHGKLRSSVTVDTIFRIESFFHIPAALQFDPMNLSFPKHPCIPFNGTLKSMKPAGLYRQ